MLAGRAARLVSSQVGLVGVGVGGRHKEKGQGKIRSKISHSNILRFLCFSDFDIFEERARWMERDGFGTWMDGTDGRLTTTLQNFEIHSCFDCMEGEAEFFNADGCKANGTVLSAGLVGLRTYYTWAGGQRRGDRIISMGSDRFSSLGLVSVHRMDSIKQTGAGIACMHSVLFDQWQWQSKLIYLILLNSNHYVCVIRATRNLLQNGIQTEQKKHIQVVVVIACFFSRWCWCWLGLGFGWVHSEGALGGMGSDLV